jgi:hypothetical protein
VSLTLPEIHVFLMAQRHSVDILQLPFDVAHAILVMQQEFEAAGGGRHRSN